MSLAAIAAVAVTALSGAMSTPKATPTLPREITTEAGSETNQVVAPVARPVYRHSVIPGGVYSPEELAAAAEHDPVVFVQYGSALRTAVRTAALPRPRRVYMSYRIGDRIYWTRNKVLLPAGETTLTNGDIEIRARCGNRISDTQMFPAIDDEPDVVEFDRLVADDREPLAAWGFAFPPIWMGSGAGDAPLAIAEPAPSPPAELPGDGRGWFDPAGVPGTVIGTSPGGAWPSTPDLPSGQPEFPLALPVIVTTQTTGPKTPDGGTPQSTSPGNDRPSPGGPASTPDSPRPAPDEPPPPGDFYPLPDDDIPIVSDVPEPGTFVLVGSALAGLAATRLRQRRRPANPPTA